MFQTAHARLAVVASVLWIPAAYIVASDEFIHWNPNYFLLILFAGWAMIWAGVFGVNWIVTAPGESPEPRKPLSFPAVPRPVYYAFVLIAIVLIMGLPKALYHFLS
jgi:hypothetical protein